MVAGAVLAWRETITISDGVIYRRTWRWHEPFLLDELVSVRVDWSWMGHNPRNATLVLFDRGGSDCELRLAWYEHTKPLVDYVRYALENDPGIRREETTLERLRT